MSIFHRAKSRLNEMREEDRKKSEARQNQRHYEKTVETMKRTELESKRKSAFEEEFEKGTIERARQEGRQKAMRKTGLGFSIEKVIGGFETGGRFLGNISENLSIGLIGESPRKPRRRTGKKKKQSVRHRKARQHNGFLW